ncbi:nickel ABC transporter permease subunit NikC [Vibrio mangrovi]|uniref:Nickel ABC transporter permease subunit NikC n=1 Tax=Vibrio mangrovi TaxID=474394 RepID=A0A1Y6IU24_9VIBR|nr:nickel ABC transporter permease subunit NikC [Vibrio mangrovi]MDW6004847.1 nickel ABC transporter permease subunit NikC [Vibrio mangrovi]SMS01138.1 Nickel transport system permease protein NikC [Vibrio mangrovi]
MTQFFRHRTNILACVVVMLLIMTALLGPSLVHWDPDHIDLIQRLQPASPTHWLGTDHLGRDIFARLITGSRVSLSAVATAIAIVLVLGITIGSLAGLSGGRIDALLMRVTDIFLTFPTLVLSLFMIAVLGTGITNVILAIALSHWAWYARMVRSIVITLRNRDFILAARMSGNRGFHLFKEHLFTPIVAQLVILATMDIGHMMLHVAGMSFLGLGVKAPTPEWGVMISDARQFIWTQPLLILWPGLALLVSVIAFNWLGDALRDHLDPYLQQEHCH